MGRICEIGRHVLRVFAETLVRMATGAPLLNSTSADGDLISVSELPAKALPFGNQVRRSGCAAHELLSMNQFLRALGRPVRHMRPSLRAPRHGARRGKT